MNIDIRAKQSGMTPKVRLETYLYNDAMSKRLPDSPDTTPGVTPPVCLKMAESDAISRIPREHPPRILHSEIEIKEILVFLANSPLFYSNLEHGYLFGILLISRISSSLSPCF